MTKSGGHGEKSWDKHSKKIQKQVNEQSKKLLENINNLKLIRQRKLEKAQIPYGHGGCEPDGGLFFLNGKLIFSIEAKKQGEEGNAIERWVDNYWICTKINPTITYLTFAIGKGTLPNKPIYETLYKYHEGKFNVDRVRKSTCYMKVDGFSDKEIYVIMERLLLKTIKENK